MSLTPASGAGKRPSLKASSGPSSAPVARPLGAVREHRASTFDDDEKEEHSTTGKKPWSSQDVFDWLHDQWVRSRHYSVKALPSYPSHVSLQEYFSGNGVCQHSHRDPHCVVYAVKGLARGLAVGYGLNSAFYLATSLFSRRMFRRPLVTLGQVFLADSSFKFARFLGAMGFVYRTLQCLFCKLRGRPGKSNSALAAFIAGITILLDSPDRRSTIAGYLVVRGLYELARTLAYHGHVRTYPHLTKWIFAVCQIPIMYSFLREPHALNKSYHRFILTMGNITPAILHHIYGSTQYDFHTCQPVYHEGTCINYNLTDFIHGATVRAPRIYIPVHVLPGLIFKRKHVMKNPLAFLVESFVAIARSCLFLASYTTIVKSGVCFWRQFLGRNESWAAGVTGLTTGLSLLFEHPARHAELMLYCVPRAIETTFNLYEAALPGWFTRLRTNGVGDVFTFCVAAALFVYCADTKPKLKNLNATIFRLIFGSGTTMTPSSPELRALQASASHVPALGSSHGGLIGGSNQSGKGEAGSDADDDASLEAEEAKVREARVARISAAVPTLPSGDAKKLASPTNTGGAKAGSPRERLPPLVVNSSESGSAGVSAKPSTAQAVLSPSSLSPSAAGEPQHARRRSGVSQDINLYSPLTPVPLLPSLIAARSSMGSTNSPPISPRINAARRHSNVEGATEVEAHTPTSASLARRGSGTASTVIGDVYKYDVFFVGWPRVLRQPVHKPLDSLASSTTSLSSSSSAASVPAAPSIFELELFLFLSALGFDCYYDATDPSAPLKASPHPATSSLSQSVPSLALPVAALPPQAPVKASSPLPAPATPSSPSGAAYHTAGLPVFDTIEATLERELTAASTSRLLLCVLSDSTFANRAPSTNGIDGKTSGSESPALSDSEVDQQYDHAEGLKRVIRARGADCLFPVMFRASRSKMQQQALSFSRERRQSLTGAPSTPTPVLTGPLSAPITNLSASVPTLSMHSPRSHTVSSPRAPASPTTRRSSAEFRGAGDIGEFFALSANGVELSASPHHIRKNNSGTQGGPEEAGSEVVVASPDDVSIEEGFHGVVATVQRLAEYAGFDSAALQRRNILLPKHNEFFRNIYLQVRAARHNIMRTVNAESVPSSPNLLMAPGHIPELIKRLRGGVVHALTQYLSAHGSMPASPALGMHRKMSASGSAQPTPTSSHSVSSSTVLTQSLSPRIAVTPASGRAADPVSSPARPSIRPASHNSSITSPRVAVSPRTPGGSKPREQAASLAAVATALVANPAPVVPDTAAQSNGPVKTAPEVKQEPTPEPTPAAEPKPTEEEEDEEEPAEIAPSTQKGASAAPKGKGPVSQGSSSNLNKKKNNRRRRR